MFLGPSGSFASLSKSLRSSLSSGRLRAVAALSRARPDVHDMDGASGFAIFVVKTSCTSWLAVDSICARGAALARNGTQRHIEESSDSSQLSFDRNFNDQSWRVCFSVRDDRGHKGPRRVGEIVCRPARMATERSCLLKSKRGARVTHPDQPHWHRGCL